MAALHAALKALGPVKFSEVPQSTEELDAYVADLFTNAELILESIPIPKPVGPDDHEPHIAANATEIIPSAARSRSPAPEPAALQKEWGKPVKVAAKENPLAISVYKLSGKDSRGAWFARRSVHEGIGFARFKEGLEMEFEQSLAVEGPPGEGNVRGIGGETRVEKKDVHGRGKVEVFRLSAQFPGPTTPRDFVTMLLTSDQAMLTEKKQNEVEQTLGSAPRHYMVISKPCDHPETQPTDSFVRGSYESVEFIREVPRKLQSSTSAINLNETSDRDLKPATSARTGDGIHLETNPVEWIMVTRSDPGGSVPRFMVERGTPGSICTDAKKFLDWACQRDVDTELERPSTAPARPTALSDRRDSHQSWRGSRGAGLEEETLETSRTDTLTREKRVFSEPVSTTQPNSGGILGAVSGAFNAYAPQVVLDHMPGHAAVVDASDNAHGDAKTNGQSTPTLIVKENDAASIASTTSFASAEDHIMSSESENPTESSIASPRASTQLSRHERELQKLEDRRAQLNLKFAENRTKFEQQTTEQTAKEDVAHKKAIEKHEREVAKQEEKYQKELRKLEQKQEKERQKLEAKRKKMADKDEKTRLTRERDEARSELEIAKKEADLLRAAMEDLRKENATLVEELGTLRLKQ